MRITSKGQVTIPQEIRDWLGLLPHKDVEFELVRDHAPFARPEDGWLWKRFAAAPTTG